MTDADEEAERLILARLAKAFPGVPVVAEEEAAAGRVAEVGAQVLPGRSAGRHQGVHLRQWRVHRQYRRSGEWRAGGGRGVRPGRERGCFLAARRAPSRMAKRSRRGPRPRMDWWRWAAAAMPTRRRRNFSERWTVKNSVRIGSSLKFCLVAAGEADIYARGGPTMEWDTAAGHAVLRAAGGSVETWTAKRCAMASRVLKIRLLSPMGRRLAITAMSWREE